jgi:hypothetical protein
MLVCVASTKTRMINVRLSEKVHEDFKIACELRGVSMSSLMHQYVIRVIREEKEMAPRAFTRIGSATVPLELHNETFFSRIPQDQLEETQDQVVKVRNHGEVTGDQIQDREADSRTPAKGKRKRNATG